MHLNSEFSLPHTKPPAVCAKAAQSSIYTKHCTQPSLELFSLYSISNCFWNTQRKILIFFDFSHLNKALYVHAALFRSWCLPWVWSKKFKRNISSPRILVSKESQEPLLGVRLIFTSSNCFISRVIPLNTGEENTNTRSSRRHAHTERRCLSLYGSHVLFKSAEMLERQSSLNSV